MPKKLCGVAISVLSWREKVKELKRLLALVGIGILVVILLNLNVGKIASLLLGISLPLFFCGVLLDLLAGVVKAKKWQLLVNAENSLLSFRKSVEYFFIGFFLSILTPARVGDLARALYLKRETKSMGKALSTVILDRLIDIVLLFALGFAAVAFFAAILGKTIIPLEIVVAFALVLAAAAIVLLKKNFIGFFLKPFFRAFVPEKFKESLRVTFEEFYGFFGKIRARPGKLLAASLLGLFTWLLAFASSFLFILALGINVPLYFVPLAVPIILLLDILPISFSGIGTRDAALIVLFGFFGVTAEEAIAFSLVFMLSGYWIVALAGAALFMRNSISLDFAQGNSEPIKPPL
jgi:hypothetical protein